MLNDRCETGNPLVVDAACGAGLSGLSRRSFSEDGSGASANYMAVLPGVLGCSFDRLRTGSPSDVPLKLPAASCRESSKCKEVIPFDCSSLANPVRLRRTMGTALAVAFSKQLLK
jgi:hypothetical protein